MDVIVRRVSSSNSGKIAALNTVFAIAFEDTVTYESEPPSPAYTRQWLNDERNIALIAEIDGTVVGGLVAFTLQKLEQARSEVYVYDIAVHPGFQRRGIGRALMTEIREIAGAQGSYVVSVQADEGDDAIKFYESLGPSENLRSRSFDFTV